MDVKNVFLNDDLDEEVYMQPPCGYFHPPGKVCKLRKALHRLKQVPHAWLSKFNTSMTAIGLQSSSHDSALFLRCTNRGFTILVLYVDDMIVMGDVLISIKKLKTFFTTQFDRKELDVLEYFLGL